MGPSLNSTVIARLASSVYGMQIGSATMSEAIAAATDLGGVDQLMNLLYVRDIENFGVTTQQMAERFVANLGIDTPDQVTEATDFVKAQLDAAAPEARGAVLTEIVNLFAGLVNNAYYGDFAKAFNQQVAKAVDYAQTPGTTDVLVSSLVPIFTLTAGMAAGADVMRLTGNQDVRINFSNPANQITGLDLDGNGIIDADGKENAITGRAAGFEIVDAYPRNPLNHKDTANNFLGDIAFDGTGFQGDGVRTNGNIFLGGLGTDTAFGGIGNDFMAGGGVAQGRAGQDKLYGGRNADFFFAEFAAIDATDGSSLWIDGGNTADNVSAGNTQSSQDSDWLLIEASDDDEPVRIWLNDDNLDDQRDADDGLGDGMGRVLSRADTSMQIDDIENVDASGNLYGFLDDMDVAIGSRAVDDRGAALPYNYGYGSTAQLWISGSNAANIIIGGYDNDYIEGRDGNDLLMGGNLNFLNHPNLTQIWNNGRDELVGGGGNDDIVFETDGGIYEGGAVYEADDAGQDTLWLTREAFGTRTIAQVTTDGVLRIDLGVGKVGGLDNYAGYGGADQNAATGRFTSDQTNYASGYARAQVQDFESVIATGLGGVDYVAAGTNSPELLFANQQNHFGFVGNLDLRGTSGVNTLYAADGNDVIEGREGDDLLSGGPGNDDFLFNLGRTDVVGGDGVDVVHRQTDADGDNLWDGTFSQDFGLDATTGVAESRLTVDLQSTDLALAEVAVTTFDVELDGVVYVGGTAAQLAAANSTAELAAILNASFSAQNADLSVVAQGNKVVVKSATGGTFATGLPGTIIAGTATNGTLQTLISAENDTPPVSQDRLIYVAYEDRADNERVDDDSVLGSTISLGNKNYAQDLVYHFGADGTRLAESQAYDITFSNLTTQDKVTIKVNGVEYSLQVGVDLDGNIVAAEDGIGDTQPAIQASFLARLRDFINSFNDKHTVAGQVTATLSGNTLTLTQAAYNGEETVFMTKPVVELSNLSLGEQPKATVTNVSSHEVHLLDFDGRDNKLNATNVLFWGDQEINRSVFETAKSAGGTLQGSEAILIDGGANDLVDAQTGSSVIAINNQATNAALATNFSVHGDDLLIGGDGNDTILGLTGDDRVIGSRGTDAVDGGKNYVRVQVLGESQARTYVLNAWEAASVANLKSVLPELAALTISSITVIDQSQTGEGTQSGLFSDTLQFQQADFAPGTKFTVTLDDFNVTVGGVVELRNDGAGTVTVDEGGDGTVDHTTTFTNFENIRTVSGTGKAVAGDGQGDDTLNVAAMSTATGGISYNLTNDGGAGEVRYSVDPILDLVNNPNDRPDVSDYESLVIRVDGVENVIAGTGADLLVIDETEAAKNNTFNAGLGVDRVLYQHNYGGPTPLVAEPTVTIKVNAAADTDTVSMTGGRNGTTVATDTLVGVEVISLAANTASGTRENDVLDVTNLTGGAWVNFITGVVAEGDYAGPVQVRVEGMQQLEQVVGGTGNDIVVLAPASAHATNNTSDQLADAKDITFATFLSFDTFDAAGERVAFVAQTSAQRPDALNEAQYQFKLDGGTDTVSYAGTPDAISVVVELDATKPQQYVLVDRSPGNFTSVADQLGDRIDVLTDVERVVASQGESILDLTSSTKGLVIDFQPFNIANRNAARDLDVYSVQIRDLGSNVPLTRSYLEFRDAGQSATIAVPTASWNRIEGSDNAEVVILNSVHSFDNDTLNLRGGANEVKYNELTRSISAVIDVTEFDANAPVNTTGFINVTVNFQDGSSNVLPGGGTHVTTSYTAGNGIAAGSLRVAASQDAEDEVTFASGADKLFILGVQGTTDNLIEVRVGADDVNSMILTGFEFLRDADSNDVYDIRTLNNVLGNLTLTDNVADDHDTIKVGNDAVTGGVVDLGVLNGAAPTGFVFDFDVLDITAITANGLTVNGETAGVNSVDGDSTDELVVGALSRLTAVNEFESIVLTDASVAGGGSFTLNTTANTLVQGSTTVTIDAGMRTLSAGGIVFEQSYRSGYVPAVSADVTLTAVGNGAVNLFGGDGSDVITGAGGNDLLVGGKGRDTLDGGVTPAVAMVRQIDLAGLLAADGNNATFTFGLLVLTEGTEITAGAGAPSVAQEIAAALNADIAGADQSGLGANGLVSVSATVGGSLVFTYAPGANATTVGLGYNPGGDTGTFGVGAEVLITPGANQVDSDDVYAFGDGDTGITLATADLITNWNNTDSIVFVDASNIVYSEALAAAANFAAAATAADLALNGTTTVNFQWDATNGYLFRDVDADGDADELIVLEGVTGSDISAANVLGGVTTYTSTPYVAETFDFTVLSGIRAFFNTQGIYVGQAPGDSPALYDTIIGFETGVDTLDMAVAGTGTNYIEVDGSLFPNVAAAVADAQANQFNFTVGYVLYYNLNGSGDGVLIADLTFNGVADGAVLLTGVATAADFDFSDIV